MYFDTSEHYMGMFVLDFLWLLLFIEAIKAETNSLEFGF
jgi:hypothetical protein